METLKIVLLVVYVISLIYCLCELGLEMKNWNEFGPKDTLFYKTLIFSILAVILPVINSVVAVKLIIYHSRLKKN
jgi:hypothetical protein